MHKLGVLVHGCWGQFLSYGLKCQLVFLLCLPASGNAAYLFFLIELYFNHAEYLCGD